MYIYIYIYIYVCVCTTPIKYPICGVDKELDRPVLRVTLAGSRRPVRLRVVDTAVGGRRDEVLNPRLPHRVPRVAHPVFGPPFRGHARAGSRQQRAAALGARGAGHRWAGYRRQRRREAGRGGC